MPESVRQDLPASPDDHHIGVRTTPDQTLVIRKAAELIGWTVPEYVLSAALDRAERDLHQHAATQPADPAPPPVTPAEPYVALLTALT